MIKLTELHTDRLILRQWQKKDLSTFAQMNACAKVMKYFPSVLTAKESNKVANNLTVDLAKKGWGVWAIEEKKHQTFIGFTGLKPISELLPFSPAIEICWRLDSQYWHKGYAYEAAKKVLAFAFNELNLKEVISFTAKVNKPSEKLMCRIGMHNTYNTFEHPLINKTSCLSTHISYRINSAQFNKLHYTGSSVM